MILTTEQIKVKAVGLRLEILAALSKFKDDTGFDAIVNHTTISEKIVTGEYVCQDLIIEIRLV